VLPPRTNRYVLSIGTAEPRKDLTGLVRAFGEVAADRPDLALVLAGPDGWGTQALDEAVASSAFRDRIVRTGWLDDRQIGSLLAGAAVLAFPSVYEGFGLPPLQAMAAGVPVVATTGGAIPEALGEAALLVAVGDVDALAAGLAEVIDDEQVRQRLVRLGCARVARFTWDRCAEGLDALYRDALDASGGRRR
jgi:alpha-1,3-rhamnosyl/mannosyltransferase